jgi:hypothetical protein
MYRSSYEDEYKLLNEDYFKYKTQDLELESLNSLNDIENHSQSSQISSSDSFKNLTKNLTSIKSQTKRSVQIPNSDERKIGKWTEEEDEILRLMVPQCGGKNWKKIAECVKGRTPIQCLHRWTKILQPGLIKGPWSVAEDKKLIEWVMKEGPTRWTQCAELIQGRNGKQCRERWFNSLNPKVRKGDWSVEEDFNLFFYYHKFGGKWSKIAIFFEGRTENSIKNRFYSTLRRLSTERKKEISINEGNFTNLSQTEKNNPQQLNLLDSNSMNDNNDNLTLTANYNSTAGIEELKQYIPLAEETVKYRLMKYYEYSDDDVKSYENKLNENAGRAHRPNRSFKVDKIKIKESIKEIGNSLDFSLNSNKDLKNKEEYFSDIKNNPNITNGKNIKGNKSSNNTVSFNTINPSPVIPQVNTFNFNLNFNSNNTNNSNNNYILNPASSNNPYHNLNTQSLINNTNNTLTNTCNNFTPSSNNLNQYKSMDIYSLEKDIVDMCDTNLFFQDNNFNFDNQLDNLLESMFQGNNIILTNDPLSDCNICLDKSNQNFNENEKFVNENKFDDIYNNITNNNLNNYSLNLGLVNNNNLNVNLGNNMPKFNPTSCSNFSTHVNANTNSNANNSSTNSLHSVNNNVSLPAEKNKEETFKSPLTTLTPLIKQTQSKKEQQAKKSDVFQNLLNQLNGLEKLVKNAKKELSKYEKKEGLEDISTIENLFKI